MLQIVNHDKHASPTVGEIRADKEPGKGESGKNLAPRAVCVLSLWVRTKVRRSTTDAAVIKHTPAFFIYLVRRYKNKARV